MKNLLAAALAAIALAGCSAEQPDRPNIVLITVDTLRWDYLNTYGFPEPDTTPTVSFLAANGMVYDLAVSTAGTTIPSHGSMLTGLYARQHGARSNFHAKYEGIPTVTEDLLAAGYQTGGFVSNQFLFKIGDLGGGFEAHNTPFSDPVRGHRPQPGDKTVNQATEWLRTVDPDRPYFMWVHLWEPHGPYDPTDWSRARLGDYDGFLKDGVAIEHTRNRVSDIVNSKANTRAMRTHYAGEVNLADQYLGRLFEAIRERGLLDNTVVIFTADHGQSLGEKKRMGHGPTTRETVIRVPLIVADFRTRAAGRNATRVGTIDIAPTIADAAGLDRSWDFAGRSLMNPGDLADDWPYFVEVAVRAETDLNWERTKDSTTYDANRLAVYTGPFKMSYYFDQYTLYETGGDLLVARKLKKSKEPVMADYLQGLIESFQAVELDLTKGEVSDEDLRILQGLGYAQ